MATAPAPREPRRGESSRPEYDQRSAEAGRPVNPVLVWLGILGGPLSFALVRLASVALISGPCKTVTAHSSLLGLSTSQQLVTAITFLGALTAAAAGLLSWHIWRRTRRLEEEQTIGSMRPVPFWSLGGIFVSAVSFIAIVLTGGLALGLSTSCAS